MKRVTGKYRAIGYPNGELLPSFFDEDGEPRVFDEDSPAGTHSVTYYPDDYVGYEAADKDQLKALIKGKAVKTPEILVESDR